MLFLNNGGLLAKLRQLDGADIAAWTSTNNDDIILQHAWTSLYSWLPRWHWRYGIDLNDPLYNEGNIDKIIG
jgi:hypothetical protein